MVVRLEKTFEEKELVSGKILVNGENGFVPCMFLLKCQSFKEFGGGRGAENGTYQAMCDGICQYIS